MSTVLYRFLLPWLVLGCSDDKNNSDTGTDGDQGEHQGQGESRPEDVPTDGVESQVVFDVVGVPYDITQTPEGVLYVSIEENGIVEWDPVVNWPEVLTERAGSIYGIYWHEGEIYYTTSDHRQSGSLSKLNGNTQEVLITAAGDVIFREPTDLTRTDDGAWILTDRTLETLIVVRGDEATMRDAGVSEPSSVTADANFVYVGGADGVSRIAWPDGSPEKIDHRSVNGLHIFAGELLGTNSEWGVFRVGDGNRLGFDDMRIPGRMCGDAALFVTDWANSGVWSTPQ